MEGHCRRYSRQLAGIEGHCDITAGGWRGFMVIVTLQQTAHVYLDTNLYIILTFEIITRKGTNFACF